MARPHANYYTNPAFSQQSEFCNGGPQHQQRKALSSPPKRQGSFRQPPVGAQAIQVVGESPRQPPKPGPKPARYAQLQQHDDGYGEQEFYEEIIVDDTGYVKDKKVVVIHSVQNGWSPSKHPENRCHNNNQPERYVEESKDRYEMPPYSGNNNRYEEIADRYEELSKGDLLNGNRPQQKFVKHRYEYIPLQEHEMSPQKARGYYVARNEIPNSRYAVVQSEEETELATNNRTNRYALVPTDSPHRYEYLDNQSQPHQMIVSPKSVRKAANPAATQKLHELLSTPKKTPQKSFPAKQEQFVVSPTNPRCVQPPKSQQKLNYTLASRQLAQDGGNSKRHTAIIAPICSSPVQSVYSETTYSTTKTESWMNLALNKPPVQATLAVAAFMMILCGGVTSGLCFYMVSVLGRLYYLDFGIVSGFACLLLGLLGFRSRNCYWLPNRNYISGYIVLSVFSLLTCAGLLVLLFMQPKPGTPLADMTSGGVCGISVLSLILASTGVLASYCCKYPPPDNRVQHCARGFTV